MSEHAIQQDFLEGCWGSKYCSEQCLKTLENLAWYQAAIFSVLHCYRDFFLSVVYYFVSKALKASIRASFLITNLLQLEINTYKCRLNFSSTPALPQHYPHMEGQRDYGKKLSYNDFMPPRNSFHTGESTQGTVVLVRGWYKNCTGKLSFSNILPCAKLPALKVRP